MKKYMNTLTEHYFQKEIFIFRGGGEIMVDTYGRWTEEKDYSTYPEEKMCDYDKMAVWIRGRGYEPETSMENLITMIFCYYEEEIGSHVSDYDIESGNFDGSYTEACQAYVEDSDGLAGFDYWI